MKEFTPENREIMNAWMNQSPETVQTIGSIASDEVATRIRPALFHGTTCMLVFFYPESQYWKFVRCTCWGGYRVPRTRAFSRDTWSPRYAIPSSSRSHRRRAGAPGACAPASIRGSMRGARAGARRGGGCVRGRSGKSTPNHESALATCVQHLPTPSPQLETD